MATSTESGSGKRLLWFLLLWAASVGGFTAAVYLLRYLFGVLTAA